MKIKTLVSALLVAVLSLSGIPAEYLSLSRALSAQATTTQTTTTAAVTDSATVIPVTAAAAAGFARGYTLVIDGEAMTIAGNYVAGSLQVNVTRGQFGTVAGAHASGAVVFAGPQRYFSETDPIGPCTAANELALPRVVLGSAGSAPGSVSVYNCSGATAATARWQRYTKDGYPAFGLASIGGTPAGALPVTYTASGAIALIPGVSYVSVAGVGAMTLANPSLYMNGMVMVIQANTANAHTVTYTAGFNGNTTSSDVATFGGAIGDNLIIYASNGVWRVLATRNVTLA